jgi:SNF2 family DNA or RNA helicase
VTGSLSVKLHGSPPLVELSRDSDVADDFWFSIPVALAPVAAAADRRAQVSVRLEQFLSNRRWLRDACVDYDVKLEIDDAMREVLLRAKRERETVDWLLSASASADFSGSAEAESLLKNSARSRYRRELRPFQRRDLARLLELEHGANFSVPGAGKTAVTYATYEAERVRDRVSRLMVIAPLSAFEAWKTEAECCFEHPLAVHYFDGRIPHATEIVLVNYQRLRRHVVALSEWLHECNSHLVLDEAHRMKRGRSGEWGSACLDLAHFATRRDVLTGTPAPQGPQDFVALLDFLWPEQARRILPAAATRSDPAFESMADVSTAIRPLFVRTTKRELDLDPPTLRVETVTMKPLQTEIYDALRNRYAGLLSVDRTEQALLAQMGEVTMYLLEAATNPALLSPRFGGGDLVAMRYPMLSIPAGSSLSNLIARYSDQELPPKFEKLAALIEQNVARRRKTLVWSNFVGNLLYLERMLARYQPALIYGAIPNEDTESSGGVRTREGELRRFRFDDRCSVLLANPAALAEGVSLHDVCHDAVYVDRTFNAGQYLQSLDRIHRLGLAPGTETNIVFLLTLGTIDEAVDARVGLKAERLGAMLDDPDLVRMALPDDEDYGEIIEDVGDLSALFEHLGEP